MPHRPSPSPILLALGIAISCSGLVDLSRANGEDLSHERAAVEIGRSIFFDTGLSRPKVQACASCHDAKHAFADPTHWEQPLLSDLGYDNLGVPTRGEKDPGLGGHTGNQDEIGQFRSPSLRNVALTAPYMHNGSIATLREVMEFYNKRDVEPQRWGATEYPQSVNHDDMGNLNLNDQQIDDLVALMQAFSDRTLVRIKPGDALPNANPDSPATREKRLNFPDWTHRLHAAYSEKSSQPQPIPG